jgi:hypothetical protein
VEAINRVRFERFDRVLQQVLLEAGDSPPTVTDQGGLKGGKGGAPGGPLEPLQDWITLNLGQWYRYSHGATPTSKVEDMSTILQVITKHCPATVLSAWLSCSARYATCAISVCAHSDAKSGSYNQACIYR